LFITRKISRYLYFRVVYYISVFFVISVIALT